jgi:hypothetical protein
MTLDALEFLRRFFLHVLCKGFVRIRHYGLLSNRFRNRLLPLAHTLHGLCLWWLWATRLMHYSRSFVFRDCERNAQHLSS